MAVAGGMERGVFRMAFWTPSGRKTEPRGGNNFEQESSRGYHNRKF